MERLRRPDGRLQVAQAACALLQIRLDHAWCGAVLLELLRALRDLREDEVRGVESSPKLMLELDEEPVAARLESVLG